MDFSASAPVSTGCSTAECENTGMVQVCNDTGDCDNGDPCHFYTCPSDFDLSVTLGLCTATAPMPCE
jgi:hypothetical protein